VGRWRKGGMDINKTDDEKEEKRVGWGRYRVMRG